MAYTCSYKNVCEECQQRYLQTGYTFASTWFAIILSTEEKNNRYEKRVTDTGYMAPDVSAV